MTEFDSAAQRELAAYLSDIETVLRHDGREPDEVETIVAAVEERVLDTATEAQRTDAANMRGLLRSLDPPEAYGRPVSSSGSVEPGAGLARVGLVLAIAGPFVGIGAGAVAGMMGSDGSAFGSLVILVAAALGVAVGLATRRHRHGRTAAAISAAVFAGYWAMLFIVDALS